MTTEPETECDCDSYQELVTEIAEDFNVIRRTIIASVMTTATNLMNTSDGTYTTHELVAKHKEEATEMMDSTNQAFIDIILKMMDKTTEVTVRKMVDYLVSKNEKE